MFSDVPWNTDFCIFGHVHHTFSYAAEDVTIKWWLSSPK